jgi:arabinogalactan oligomer/maltooligosaccharide transport system substrate-binding protein
MRRCLSVLLAMTFLLGGCSAFRGSGAVETEAPEGPILTRQNIELTVWAETREEAFVKAAAEEFTKKYPNIKIRTETLSTPEIFRRVKNDSASGKAADIFSLPHTEIRELAEGLFILPARNQARVRAAVFPACAQAAAVGGAIYGYPVSSDTTVLFYNKKLISEDKLPATWDGLIALAKEPGFVLPIGSPNTAAVFISAKNNRPNTPGGEAAEDFNLLTPAALEGMEVFRKLKGAVGLSSEELSGIAAEAVFAQGNAAFYMGGFGSMAKFTGIDFGVVPLPAFSKDEESEEPSASLASTRVMVVSAHSQWPDEASAFADTLISEEMQRIRVDKTGDIPSVDVTLRSPAYAAGFLAQMQNAYSTTAMPQSDKFWEAFGKTSARIWDGGNAKTELEALIEELRVPEEEPEEPPGGNDTE